MALVVIGALVYIVFALSNSAGEVKEEERSAAVESSLVQVADPLARLCQEDPTVRARVGPACTAAAEAVTAGAERGADGRAGAPGVAGTPGIPGVNGLPGQAGVDGENGADGGVGASGAPGAPGANGVDGVSPACLQESGQCRGADGAMGPSGPAGPAGEKGDPGANGANAELPTSYTKNFSDGRTETCTRTGGEDTAPVYSCTTG